MVRGILIKCLELPTGSLKHVTLVPFRHITEIDMKSYTGHHPRKMKGQPETRHTNIYS
jgi:hypothetical protein